MRRIITSTHLTVALRQPGTGCGWLWADTGNGGRSCGHGGFGSCEACAAGAPARAATAVAAAIQRIGPLPDTRLLGSLRTLRGNAPLPSGPAPSLPLPPQPEERTLPP